MLNSINVIGRLVRDPETKNVSGNYMASFTIASDASYKGKDGNYVEKANFIPVTVWGNSAKWVKEKLSKGLLVCVSGSLESNTVEKEGRKATYYNVRANLFGGVELLQKKEQAATNARAEVVEENNFYQQGSVSF